MKDPIKTTARTRHSLAVPVGDALRGDGETDVVEALKDDAADVIGAVLVAGADDQLPVVVGLRQFGVETFQDPLADAARLTHPGGVEMIRMSASTSCADPRPGVAAAYIELDPRFAVSGAGSFMWPWLPATARLTAGSRTGPAWREPP